MAKSSKGPKKGQKLLRLLESLDGSTLKEFHKFLQSPYFGKSPAALRMMEVLEKSVINRGYGYIPLEKFDKVISPEKELDDKKLEYIRIRLVDLQDRLLDFLAINRYRQRPEIRNRLLFEEAIERGWEYFIPGFYQKGLKSIPQQEGSERFSQQLQLEKTYNAHLSLQAVKGMDLHLDPVLEHLDSFYLLEKLKFSTAALNLKWIWKEEREIVLIDAVLDQVRHTYEQQSLIIQAYYHAYQMLFHAMQGTEESQTHFEKLVLLMENPLAFTPSDAHSIFLYAQNYCILRFHLGDRAFFVRLKQLYDQILSSGTLLKDGQLSAGFFKNTVNLMCRFGELSWVESFIESYKDRISGDSKGLAYIFNLAVLRFYQREFKETVRLLFPAITLFGEVLYAIGARTYLCRAFWEQKDWEGLLHSLYAFRQFIQRNADLPPGDRSNTRLFINYMEQITKAMTLPVAEVKAKLLRIHEKLHSSGEHLLLVWVSGVLDLEIKRRS